MVSNARQLAQVPSVPSGRRNLIINGAMQVAQRATSSTGQTATNAIFTVDRFNTEISGPTSFDIARVTDSPDGFSYSLKVTSNGSFSASSGQYIVPFEQRLEGQDLQHLSYGTSSAKSITVSFHIKSTKTGTYVLQARHESTAGQERIQAQSYTIDSANTWEKKTIVFSGDTGDDIKNDNTAPFTFYWWMIAGSGFSDGTLATSWQDTVAGNRAVGVASSSADDDSWQITGVQMEVGSVATEFEHRSFGEELALCQRYYYNSVQETSGINAHMIHILGVFTTTRGFFGLDTPVPMRSAPTIGLTGSANLRTGNLTAEGTLTAVSIYAAMFNNTRFSIDCTFGSSTANTFRGISLGQNGGFLLDAEL